MGYVSCVSNHAGVYAIDRVVKKPDSALERLRALEKQKIVSEAQDELIQKAAREIFARYNFKANSLMGGLESFIKRILELFGVKNLRREQMEAIKTIYHHIIKSRPVEPPSIKSQFKKLKSAYAKTIDLELARLRKTKILNHEIENIVDTGIFENINSTKAALGKALEIKRLLGKTHYVFTHGQATPWVIVSYLIKELVRNSYSREDIQGFKFLRAPSDKKYNITHFQGEIFDHDEHIRQELISADAYLPNTTYGESALHYLSRNRSILDIGAITRVAGGIINKLVVDGNKRARLNNIVNRAINKLINEKFGTLHVICVPRKLIDSPHTDFRLRTHPFGEACHCDHIKRFSENTILDFVQNDVMIDELQCGEEFGIKMIPQWRLLVSKLAPKQGVLVRTITPVSKETRRAIKKEIRSAI